MGIAVAATLRVSQQRRKPDRVDRVDDFIDAVVVLLEGFTNALLSLKLRLFVLSDFLLQILELLRILQRSVVDFLPLSNAVSD